MKFSLVSTLSLLFSAAYAAPHSPEARGDNHVLDSISPKILEPTAKTTWVVGNQATVTWDLSTVPPIANISNPVAKIILGQFNGDEESLDFEHPIANGFLITDGHVTLTVPHVPDGNYMIVLFGNSGDTSPQFKIVNNPLSSILGPSQAPSPTPQHGETSSSTPPPTPTPSRSSLSPSPTSPSGKESASDSSASPSSSPSAFTLTGGSSSVVPGAMFSAPSVLSQPSSSSQSTPATPSTTSVNGSAANGAEHGFHVSYMNTFALLVLSAMFLV